MTTHCTKVAVGPPVARRPPGSRPPRKPASPALGGGHGVLVTAQVTTVVMLLLGAGLLARTLWHTRTADAGFDIEAVLVASFHAPHLGKTSAAGYQKILDKVVAEPGVTAATWVRSGPLDGWQRGE